MARGKRSRVISIFFFFLLFYWDTWRNLCGGVRHCMVGKSGAWGVGRPLSSPTLSEFQAPLSTLTPIFAKYLFKGFIRKCSWRDRNPSAAEILECKMVCNDQPYKASIAKITALKSHGGNPAQNLPALPCLVLKLNLPKLHLVPLNGKFLNSNDPDQVLCVRETEHPTQTLVFTKTAGR